MLTNDTIVSYKGGKINCIKRFCSITDSHFNAVWVEVKDLGDETDKKIDYAGLLTKKEIYDLKISGKYADFHIKSIPLNEYQDNYPLTRSRKKRKPRNRLTNY